jgi:hypothetical protein
LWKGWRISLRGPIFLKTFIIGFFISFGLFLTTEANSWGLKTHKVVNELACEILPQSSLRTFFSIHKQYISRHAIDPDVVFREIYGNEEGIKHFINLDAYGQFPFEELPRNYQQAVRKFGREKIKQEGILPWWIIRSQKRLQQAMENGDWKKVRLKASHLGHYAADLFMPFHNTLNYDGQLTGNEGIHKRLENGLVNARIEQYRPEIKKRLKEVLSVRVKLEDIFDYSLRSWLNVEVILESDRAAGKGMLGFFDMSWLYYRRLDGKLKPIMIKQLTSACQLSGNIWFSAWIQAGKPTPLLTEGVRSEQ